MGRPGDTDRLLPSWRRGSAGAVAALGVAAVAVPAFFVAHTATPGAPDEGLDRWAAARFAGHHTLAAGLADVGGPGPVAIGTAVLAVLFLLARRPWAAVLAVLAAPVTALVVEAVLKPLVGRTLDGELSYPSGHAAGLSALVVVVALGGRAATRGLRRAAVRVLAATVSALVVLDAVSATALVAAGYHDATDTVGGAGTAVACVFGLATAIDGARVTFLHERDKRLVLARFSRERRFRP